MQIEVKHSEIGTRAFTPGAYAALAIAMTAKAKAITPVNTKGKRSETGISCHVDNSIGRTNNNLSQLERSGIGMGASATPTRSPAASRSSLSGLPGVV